MDWDIRPAAADDDLTLALDYAAVSQRVLDYVSASSFELVETLADRLATLIMEEFSVPGLRLVITKPGAVSEARRGVGGIIERGRSRAGPGAIWGAAAIPAASISCLAGWMHGRSCPVRRRCRRGPRARAGGVPGRGATTRRP